MPALLKVSSHSTQAGYSCAARNARCHPMPGSEPISRMAVMRKQQQPRLRRLTIRHAALFFVDLHCAPHRRRTAGTVANRIFASCHSERR